MRVEIDCDCDCRNLDVITAFAADKTLQEKAASEAGLIVVEGAVQCHRVLEDLHDLGPACGAVIERSTVEFPDLPGPVMHPIVYPEHVIPGFHKYEPTAPVETSDLPQTS